MQKKISTSIIASLLLSTNLYSAQSLETITVTSATKSTQSIKDVTSNIEVITKEEIEERHFTTVSEALNTLTGVNITSNGGIGQLDSVTIRGMSSKRILILIDGIRYNEPAGLSGAPLSQLMIDNIERIEVLKGAQSGIWGSDASGGIINIISSTNKKGFHGNALAEFGSFNTKKLAATLSNKTDKYFLKLNVNKIKTDGFSVYEPKKGTADYGKRGDELGLEKDGYENKTYNFQAGLNITDNDDLSLSYKKIDSKYDYDYGYGYATDSIGLKSKLDHYFKAANYTHRSEKTSTKFSMQQSKFDRTNDTFNAKSKVTEFLIESTIDYASNSSLTVGLNKQNFEDINNKNKYNTKAVFISNRNSFDKLILSQTVRYDNNSKFDEKVTGKIGAKYNFTKKLNISTNYGTAYNAPTLSNLNYTATLKPETTKSFDLNLEYYDFKVTYFDTKITDMIDYKFVPSFYYLNTSGESKLKGYEVSYKKNIIEDLLISANYTHLSAQNSSKQDLARRAKNQIALGLDYYGIDKLHINTNASYIGTRYDSVNKSGASTGNYTVWNSVINYEINKTFSTYLKVDNLFDKYYQTVDGYATAERSAYVGLKATF